MTWAQPKSSRLVEALQYLSAKIRANTLTFAEEAATSYVKELPLAIVEMDEPLDCQGIEYLFTVGK